MKKPNQSISFKIWKTMVLTIGLFLLVVVLINATVINSYKKDIYYNQLEEASKAKLSNLSENRKGSKTENSDAVYDSLDETVLITHFGLFFIDNQKLMHVDSFTKSVYPGEVGLSLLKVLSSEITKNTPDKQRGQLKIDDIRYLYYVEWIEADTQALVFFTPELNNDKGFLFILLIFIGIMIMSFFTSKLVAAKLVKPIQELEVFAQEVAKRNWDAKVPITDPDEIGLLATSLKNMRDSLKIAEERDREFLQSTSHDLKTPVMIIKGYAQALIDGIEIDSKTSAAQVIKTEAQRLERRITQLLQLNSISHSLDNRTDRDIVRIDRIIKSLVSRCRVVNPQLEWDVNLTPFELNGNADSLLVAFENILDNQMRYADSIISITMDSHPHHTRITIYNDGPNFNISDPMLLFDSYRKDLEGKFGLGLAIVEQVITAHDGTITASNCETGVTFNITFP